jgi:hypothetical protein
MHAARRDNGEREPARDEDEPGATDRTDDERIASKGGVAEHAGETRARLLHADEIQIPNGFCV